MSLPATLLRLCAASITSAAGGGAAASIPLLIGMAGWPRVEGIGDLLALPLLLLIGIMAGAGMGAPIAAPWTALAGSAMLVVSGRLGLRSREPWLAAGLVCGVVLMMVQLWDFSLLDKAGTFAQLVGGAVGGMVAAWLFRHTWLLLAGAEAGDVPTF